MFNYYQQSTKALSYKGQNYSSYGTKRIGNFSYSPSDRIGKGGVVNEEGRKEGKLHAHDTDRLHVSTKGLWSIRTCGIEFPRDRMSISGIQNVFPVFRKVLICIWWV